jgi:hypothetical protein
MKGRGNYIAPTLTLTLSLSPAFGNLLVEPVL